MPKSTKKHKAAKGSPSQPTNKPVTVIPIKSFGIAAAVSANGSNDPGVALIFDLKTGKQARYVIPVEEALKLRDQIAPVITEALVRAIHADLSAKPE